MMTSRALKAVSRDSKAALEKWKRAAQEIDAINSLQPSPGNGDPRFICNPPRVTHCDHAMMVFIMKDSIEDSDFARLTPHKQFTLLFQFQAQCAANALRSFDFGGRSMHGMHAIGRSGPRRKTLLKCGNRSTTSWGSLRPAGHIFYRSGAPSPFVALESAFVFVMP